MSMPRPRRQQAPVPPPAGRRLPPPSRSASWRQRYAWVLTLSWPGGPVTTFRGSFTPEASATRTSVLTAIYDDTVKNHATGVKNYTPGLTTPAIMFWSLEPEELT